MQKKILYFQKMSEKSKLRSLSFYLHEVKDTLKMYVLFRCRQVSFPLRDKRMVVYKHVKCTAISIHNQYVKGSSNASVFKFGREESQSILHLFALVCCQSNFCILFSQLSSKRLCYVLYILLIHSISLSLLTISDA